MIVRPSESIQLIVYIPCAFYRSGVAIYTNIEANLGQLIIELLRRICTICVGYKREWREFKDLINGGAADFVYANVEFVLKGPCTAFVTIERAS